ncbi:MAG TPA: hypothetical protein VMQ17_09850 [Candidatus Sulfotelmatobacter sp.]|jgi:hypothetical protein|nr:hypothetical protein [Candidatus Sulfotelmatobacter sp.]
MSALDQEKSKAFVRTFPTSVKNPQLIPQPALGYNDLVPETKPFRLTESVKAAG